MDCGYLPVTPLSWAGMYEARAADARRESEWNAAHGNVAATEIFLRQSTDDLALATAIRNEHGVIATPAVATPKRTLPQRARVFGATFGNGR